MDYREHYKEKNPIETVEEIKRILLCAGVDVIEKWLDVSEIDTYTVRIVIKGTEIGTNGKGVTKEYALASGYAEFMERLENDMLLGNRWFQNLHRYMDSTVISTEELIKENNSFIRNYFLKLNMQYATKAKKIKYLEKMEILEKQVGKVKNGYTCIPFYSINKAKIDYLPAAIYPLYYGSNGMCAGNTREEALVQGMSEIVERYVQKRCFKENISFPDFPEKEIKKYPYIYKRYEKLKSISGIRVWMKDCSMGGKYPVTAVIILCENTGKYGMKFGCHPILSIAMERALTEATQGQSILHFTTSSSIDFNNTNVSENFNIENAMKAGIAQYPHQIFSESHDYAYRPCKDYRTMTNKEILSDWCRSLMSEGWEILIRDASYLGFHAYHIIIPGISEIREISESFSRIFNTRLYASVLMHDMKCIDKTNLPQVVGAIESAMMCISENRLYHLFSSEIVQELPATNLQEENSLFCCYAYFIMNNFEKALEYITCIINKAVEKKDDNVSYYLAVKYYISGYVLYKDHKKVMEYLRKMFSNNVLIIIDELFKDKEKILLKEYSKYQITEEALAKSPIRKLNDRLVEIRNDAKVNQMNLSTLLLE